VALNPTAVPTKRAKGKKNPNPGLRPGTVDLSERWIDVDLSAQTVFAMQGDQIVNRFLVSTGRWPTVTVTGVFRIYVKYHAADMSGSDYYLPDVPYVMYFYKDYGLHGTYCTITLAADEPWLSI
jgi:lipoprotein-anchoring transpeptidase ErfK/SrfK